MVPGSEGRVISSDPQIGSASPSRDPRAGGLSLLFVPGQRPDAVQIAALAAKAIHPAQGQGPLSGSTSSSPVPRAQQFFVSHQPDNGENWLELLGGGMTFELTGLAPGPASVQPPNAHYLGLDPAIGAAPLDAVALHPGPHLAGGEGLLPVVRMTAAIGAALAALPGVQAVCWHAARSWVGAPYFVHAIEEWLGGGAFPALGLTSLVRGDDGSFTSEGLALLIGQEVRVEPGTARKSARRQGDGGGNAGAGGSAGGEAASARLALRAIHSLVLSGAIHIPTRLTGPEGEQLAAEPSADLRLVRVRREE